MKIYFTVQPEVIVGLGASTEFREKSSPFKPVTKLHIHLEDWLGDDLMECYPCYIVTEKLKKLLDANSFKGFVFTEMEVTKAENCDNNYHPNNPLPNLYWLQIRGRKNIDDIYINDSNHLNIADTFLTFLKSNATLNHLEVEPERNEFDDILDQMISESRSNQLEKGLNNEE
jgi:hypothetical protein